MPLFPTPPVGPEAAVAAEAVAVAVATAAIVDVGSGIEVIND